MARIRAATARGLVEGVVDEISYPSAIQSKEPRVHLSALLTGKCPPLKGAIVWIEARGERPAVFYSSVVEAICIALDQLVGRWVRGAFVPVQ